MLLISNTSYYWTKWSSWFILIGFALFLALILMNVFSLIKLSKKSLKNSKCFPPLIYTLTIILSIIYPSGVIDYEQFQSEIILSADREGVANCMTRLYFRKDNSIEEKQYCFGYYYKKGHYVRKQDIFFIYGLNDTTIFDIAKLTYNVDEIGHVNKKLEYYNYGDTMQRPLIYDAFDEETECKAISLNSKNTDYAFLVDRLDTMKLLLFEQKKGSVRINRDGSSMGGSYYPLFKKYPVGNPISFMRKYNGGIPLETNYYYSNDTLMVQYYEWSDMGCVCLKDLTKKDFETLFKEIKEMISKKKGEPINVIRIIKKQR
jgi:hypothetical protein